MPSKDSQNGIAHTSFGAIILLLFIVWLYARYNFTNDFGNDIVDFDYRSLSVWLSVLILIYPLSLYLKDGFIVFLRADVLVTTSLIYWTLLDLIQDRYSLFSSSVENIRYAFVLIAVFIIAVQLSSRYSLKLPQLAVQASKIDIKTSTLYSALVICVLIGIFPFWRGAYYDFEYMISSLTRPRFAAPWARGESGGFEAFFEHLKYFGYITPALSALIWVKEGKFNLKVIFAIILALCFSVFEFQGGGRRITGFLFGSAAITYMVAKRNNLQLKHFVVIGLLSAGVLVLLDMQLQFRNRGYANMFEKYDVEQFEKVKVDDNFLRIVQIVEFVPEIHPYSGTQYIVWAFGRPIPRFFWSSKPVGPGFDIANLAGEVGVSLSMTVVGESYASYGIVMVILVGIFFGIVSGTLNQLLYADLSAMGYSLYALGLMALVGGVRSLADLIVFSYAFLGLLFIYKVYIKK